MRRAWRIGVLAAGLLGLVWVALMPSSGAQVPPPPTLPPGFTFPTFPSIPTIPPPTMPPPTSSPTTSPPPTMPPPTSSTTMPPPTMPPPTSSPTSLPGFEERIDQGIENIIDRLEQFGDQFQDIIDELRDLQGEF